MPLISKECDRTSWRWREDSRIWARPAQAKPRNCAIRSLPDAPWRFLQATRLAENAGIDAGRLPEALAGGFADSIPLQLFVPRMVQGIHSPPLGHIATILKDLDTVVEV